MTDLAQEASGLAQVRGAPLYFEIAGAGHPLVLLHAGFADSRMFDDQFAAFAGEHRVIRYDRHGSGRSGVPTTPYTDHDALRELLRQLGIERASLLGMSAGGALALDFYLAYPAMVDSLILAASVVSGYRTTEKTMAGWAEIGAALSQGTVDTAVELTLRMWVDGSHRRPQEVEPSVRDRMWEMMLHYFTRLHGEPQSPDPPAIGRLAEIHCPTLIVVGAGDVQDVLEQADLLQRGIHHARKVVIPDVAHVLNMERPVEFNRLVLDFLSLSLMNGGSSARCRLP